VLSNISLTPRRLGHRELLLRADVLIHPQPLGMSRSLTLAAMAHGVPIVAQDDPWLDYLIDDQTTWIVEGPHVDEWVERLLRLMERPEDGLALARSARDWVRQHRQATTSVDRMLHMYRRMTGETLKFPQ
jgi:glycosyltransferase involved in cell wall biosynthesis